MTPLERYQKDLKRADFSEDPAQLVAVQALQQLYDELITTAKKNPNLVDKIKQKFGGQKAGYINGLYFWGGVGRGKTYLVDMFYETLPLPDKKRIHFHRFMQWVHKELKALNNTESPLAIIAEKFRRETSVLCFDEFHVTDITDAMLLGNLLKELFAREITLIATSNEPPDDLYSNGLQRERFIPAIELIKQYTEVINVDNDIDYRLRYLDKAEVYHYPLNESADNLLADIFTHVAPDQGSCDTTLEIENRPVKTIRSADGVVWFDFHAICDGPRGAADYIEIARVYQTVLISSIPVFDESTNDQARRFMTLVDEFYDRQVKLVLSAEADPEYLYCGKRLLRDFQRTISRLQEMRSHDYLAKQHLS